MHAELFEDLRDQGFEVRPGQLGKNITTQGWDLLGLPRGARLQLGATVVLEVTGHRNPCAQIYTCKPGCSGLSFTAVSTGPWSASLASWPSW